MEQADGANAGGARPEPAGATFGVEEEFHLVAPGTYRLTEEGLDWLHAWAGALRETRRILDVFLEDYEKLTEGMLDRR